jgi:hypothetical protein
MHTRLLAGLGAALLALALGTATVTALGGHPTDAAGSGADTHPPHEGRPAAADPAIRTPEIEPAVSRRPARTDRQAALEAQVARLLAAKDAKVAPPPPPPLPPRRTNVNWDGIARCETGGNWSMQGPRYSGGLGFANSTWDAFGGREFAPNAGLASREQQIVVAERVHARYGLSGWGCRRFG